MCFLSTTFSNAKAHPPLYFLTSPTSRAEKKVAPKIKVVPKKIVVPKKNSCAEKERVVPEKTDVVKKKLDEKN